MKTVAMPTASSTSSGTASTISSVTRWKPRGRARSSICRWIHTSSILAGTRQRTYGGAQARRTRTIGQRRSMDPPLRERCAGGTPQTTMSRARHAGEDGPHRRAARLLPGALVCLIARAACPATAQLRRRRPARHGRRRGGPRRRAADRLRPHPDLGVPRRRRARHGAAHGRRLRLGLDESRTGRCRTSGSRGFVFYFFSRAAALVHLALIAAGVRARARGARTPAENPLDGWIATVATLLVTGLSRVHRPRPARTPDRRPQRRRPPATRSPSSSTGAASRRSSTSSSNAPAAPTSRSA